MPHKNMDFSKYKAWIKTYGWYLVHSGAGDYKLYDDKGKIQVLFVKVTHPGKKEVIADSVKMTKKALKDAGLE